MDTQRLILFVIFSFSLLMLYDAWQRENRPAQPASQPAAPSAVPTPSPRPAAPAAPGVPAAPSYAVPATGPAAPAHEPIRVETDYFRAEIDPVGGDIVRLELLHYQDTLDPTKTYALLSPEHRYAAQSGLIGPGLPNHKTLYTPQAMSYKLADGADSLEVKLEAATPEGVRIVKALTFRRSSYVIDIAHEIANGAIEPVAPHAYFQLTRDGRPPGDDKAMVKTYTGPALYTEQDKFVKVPFADIEKGKTP